MNFIDGEGRVFGVVNIIDLLVALFVLAVVVAGAALVVGPDDATDDRETVTVTVRATGIQPYVADALAADAVEGGNVTAIENVSVQPAAVFTQNESGAVLARDHPRLRTVEVDAVVEATNGSEGLVFGTTPLRVGQNVSLDAGTVVLSGQVTAIRTSDDR